MIIAKVNNYESTFSEFKFELNKVLNEMKLKDSTEEIKKRSLNQLIDGYLLLESAKNSEIEVEDSEIENEMIELKMRYNSEDEFMMMLHKNQIDIEKVRDRISNNILIRKFVNLKFPMDCKVTEQKLFNIYQENMDSFKTNELIRASHNLIENTDKEAEEKINEIHKKIKSLEDFQMAAAECSDCPSTCNSGDLGYFSKGKMVKAFEEVAFNLAIGEISNPVETKFGYHIIVVTDKKKSKIAEFSEVKESLKMRLQRIDSELKLINHIKKLREKANILINRENI